MAALYTYNKYKDTESRLLFCEKKNHIKILLKRKNINRNYKKQRM